MSTLRMTSDLRRQLILGAAKRCFARNGFAGTTTKSVAAAAAISEGLLFKHFPSKAALYAEILAEECEADPDLAHLLGQEPSTATLVELVKGMVGHFLGVAGDEEEGQRLRLMTTSHLGSAAVQALPLQGRALCGDFGGGVRGRSGSGASVGSGSLDRDAGRTGAGHGAALPRRRRRPG